jgi:nucleotide-binding universal stress UspA family protein
MVQSNRLHFPHSRDTTAQTTPVSESASASRNELLPLSEKTTIPPIATDVKGAHMTIKTILHPTDFSASSRHALEFACSLARDHAARIVMLHVIDNPRRIVEPGLPPQELDERRVETEHWFTTLPRPQGNIETKQLIAEGEPVHEILRLAAEEGADLIVLGTHGRTGMQRLLMGSVAESVIRQAPCPVVAVKVSPHHAVQDQLVPQRAAAVPGPDL